MINQLNVDRTEAIVAITGEEIFNSSPGNAGLSFTTPAMDVVANSMAHNIYLEGSTEILDDAWEKFETILANNHIRLEADQLAEYRAIINAYYLAQIFNDQAIGLKFINGILRKKGIGKDMRVKVLGTILGLPSKDLVEVCFMETVGLVNKENISQEA